MFEIIKKKNLSSIYWFIPIFLIIPQAIYTFQSMNQIRLEETIESFRSVWFFDQRLVWNGSYTNSGWAALQNFIYHIFGFHFFTGKAIKLAVQLVSFLCLYGMLKKYFGVKKSLIPLITFIFSPTLLYFNSLQMPHGLDVSFFLICLSLIVSIDFKKVVSSIFLSSLTFLLVMLGWMTYGGFIFYLPILGLIYLYKLYTQNTKISKEIKAINIFAAFISFLIPFVLLYLYIDNKQVLVDDPLTHKGIFRSYGNVEISTALLSDNYYRLWSDLSARGISYYFEPEFVEFSKSYPLVSIISVIIITVLLYIRKKDKRFLVILFGLLFVLSLILVGVAGPKTLGGIRRGTVLLVLFYGFYILAWDYVFKLRRPIVKLLLIVSLLFLPFHHMFVYPANLENLAQKSRYREYWWFNSDTTPDKVFNDLLKHLQTTDVILPCLGTDLENGYCKGLSLIYPELALACKYNHLKCNNVYVLDPRFSEPALVNIDYWGRGTHVEP